MFIEPDPTRPAVPAATVIPLRDSDGGVEILMLRRDSRVSFVGGMWVFPGGKVDAADFPLPDDGSSDGDHPDRDLPDRAPPDGDHPDRAPGADPTAPSPERLAAALRAAAVREAREEAGLTLDPGSLVHLSHWTPPPEAPKRYSTAFFAVSAPSQEVVIDDAEIRAARWVSADEALALHAAGEIELAPPTVVTLHQLRRFLDTGAATADELVAAIDADPVVEHFTTALLPGHDPLVVAWHGDVALSQGDIVHSAEPDSVLGPRHRLTMSPGGFAYERDDATHATRFGRSALDLPPPDALIRLPSGRRLAVDLRGPVGGVPVLVVHGTPDSRLARHPDDSLAEAAGVRMIIPDRPGCGDSDPDPDSTPDSVADDMVALLGVLAVERCGVLAWSAGALFAVPLAVRHPDRIGSLVLAAPLSPVTSWSAPEVEEQLTAERRAFGETVADVLVAEGEDGLPGLCAELVPFLVPDPLDAETALALALGDDEYRAAEVSAVPGAATQLASALAAAVHQGPTGVARDLLAQTLPVDPSGVRCPSAVISGDQDTACPLPMGRWWADVIPGASFEIRAGGGHCFPLSDWEDLLRRAAGLGPEQPTDD